MRSRRFLLTAPVLIAFSMLASSALAQDVTVPMPGEYAAPGTAPAPGQIPDPTAILQDDGSTFAIPIPGGGDIQVQGPASETPARIGPLENWATQRTNPFSVSGGPSGPIPPQQ
jgi:hypothetical protein